MRTLLVQGELPELHIEQKQLRTYYDNPLASIFSDLLFGKFRNIGELSVLELDH